MSRKIKLNIPLKEDGMGPDNLLWEKFKVSRMFKFPISGGISPVNELLPKSSSSRNCNFPISEGILNRFLPKFNFSSLTHSPSLLGIEPPSLFPSKSRRLRFDRLPISAGIFPESLLLLRERTDNDPKLPKSFGISPTRWFDERSRTRS